MKRSHALSALCFSAGLFIFVSCPGAESVLNNLFGGDVPSSEADLTYSESDLAWNLGDSTSISISGVLGKEILFVNYNNTAYSNPNGGTSNYTIPASSTRVLQSATGVSTSYSNSRSVVDAEEFSVDSDNLSLGGIKHFVPKEDFSSMIKSSSASRAISGVSLTASTTSNASVVSSLIVGTSTKKIYVDNDVNLSTYALKTATLQAIGYASGTDESYTYGTSGSAENAVCLVWVVEDCLSTDSSSGKQVTQVLAEDVASKFAKLYYHERDVFGKEYDGLITSSGTLTSSTGDTGTLVNIVIYDIGNDYGKDDQCGVVGYFYAKDYYQKSNSYSNVLKYTNAGKYFYLDAAFCNLSGTDSNGKYQYNGNSNSVSDTAITTIYHEFQHMIDFNQKEIASNGSVSAEHWYNEMLSMLAEDMFATGLEISDDDAPWGARFPGFNSSYFYSGIDEYRESGYSVISYSTAYTFGAWLARQYGGPSYVSTVSKDHTDGGLTSLISASGTSYSSRQLFKLFIKDVVQQTGGFAASSNTISSYNFTSKMPAVNLYDTSYRAETKNGTVSYDGPGLFGPTTQVELRPHGFAIHGIGTATSDTVTLTFTSRQYDSEDVMIYAR